MLQFLLLKYFTVSTYELFAGVWVVVIIIINKFCEGGGAVPQKSCIIADGGIKLPEDTSKFFP
jgi:hypothetical protein